MTVINNATLILKDKQGNEGVVKSLTNNDIIKIANAITDVGQVVDPATHMPIEATTASVGVVQLATAQDITNGTAGKVVDAKELAEVASKANAITVSDTAPNVSTMPVASGVMHPSQNIITENPDVSILALQNDMWAYDATKTYAVGSYVFDENKDICKCIQANGPTNIHAPSDSAYWLRVALNNELADKADKNLSNVTAPIQAFKNMSISWGMPDYSAGIAVTSSTLLSGFTAPSDGILVLSIHCDGNLAINGQTVGNLYYQNYWNHNPIPIPLTKNDVLKINSTNLVVSSCNFYSFKGAN